MAALAIKDDLAFVLFKDAGLAILDLSDPAQPKQIGSYKWFEVDLSRGVSLSVVDNFAYVLDEFDGLHVIEVANPSRPHEIGSFYGYFQNGKVAGGFAYLASWQYHIDTDQYKARIEVIDLGDPAEPRRVGELEIPGHIGGMATSDSFLYTVGSGGLQVIDVNDPANPLRVGAYIRDGAGDWFDVAVHETKAYVAMNSDHAPGQMNGVGILDVADPTSPQWVGRADAGGADPWRLAVTDGFVFAQGFYGVMKVIDVGNRASPRRVGGYDTDDTGFYGGPVETFGSFVCVANSFGFQIIDVHKPAHVTRVGSGVTTLMAEDVAVDGHFAYVIDLRHPSSLRVVDVSDPASPELMGHYEHGGVANRVRVFGHFAYLAGSFEWSGGSSPGVLVIDVSDPHNPRRAGGYQASSNFHIGQLAVSASGDLVFLDTGEGGLQVIDVTDPTHPMRTESYDVEELSWDFSVHDGFKYVPTRSGLEVFDVNDPENPRRVAANTSFRARTVFAHGNHVYVAGDHDGLIILNKYTELRIGPAIVLSDGRVQLQLSGPSGQRVQVQRSGNLVDWEDWQTVTLDGTGCELIDETAAASQRFYRAVEDNSMDVR